MDFGYTPEQETLRQEVIDWIGENVTAEVVAEMKGGEDGREAGGRRGRGPLVSALFKQIGEKGWLGIAWPKKYGGQDGDRMSQYIVEEEFSRVGIGVGGGGSGAPAIMAAGTEEQKDYYIPKLISGEFSLARGFTQPSRGVDLVSLSCRAFH